MATYERTYEDQEFHTVTLFGTDWKLPLVEIRPGTYIASDARLVLGTTEFVEQAAAELVTRLDGRSLEYLVTPEAKSLPLTQVLAQRLGVEYAVVRKSVKDYMTDPHVTSVESITTAGEQRLVLDGSVAEELRASRVGVVDDAVSTGGTMEALDALLADVGADVVSKAAVFEEGRSHSGVETLASLPLFVDD
jgi:adenine phosphoribosyltransferase